MAGTSFSNSTEVTPGTWTDSVAVGETVFYRIRLETGQRLRVTAEMPAPKTAWRLHAAEVITTRVAVYSPARVNLTEQTAYLQGRGRVVVTAASPEIRVRNRKMPQTPGYREPNVTTAATAGDYFVGLQLDPLQYDLAGRVMQVRLSLAIEGSHRPTRASPSPSPIPRPLDPGSRDRPATDGTPYPRRPSYHPLAVWPRRPRGGVDDGGLWGAAGARARNPAEYWVTAA